MIVPAMLSVPDPVLSVHARDLLGVPSDSSDPESPTLDIHSRLPWLAEPKHSDNFDFRFDFLTDSDSLAEYEELLDEALSASSDNSEVYSSAAVKYDKVGDRYVNDDTQTTIYEEELLELDDDFNLVPVAKTQSTRLSVAEEDLLSPYNVIDDEEGTLSSPDNSPEEPLANELGEHTFAHNEKQKLTPSPKTTEPEDYRNSKDGKDTEDSFPGLGEFSSESQYGSGQKHFSESTADDLEDLLSDDGLYELPTSNPYTHNDKQPINVGEPRLCDSVERPMSTTLSVQEPNPFVPTHTSDSLSAMPCVILEYESSFYSLFSPFNSDPDADVLFSTLPDTALWTVEKLGCELSNVFGITSDVVIEFPTLELSFSPKSAVGETMRLEELVRIHEAVREEETTPLKMLLLECRNSFEERWGVLENLVQSRKRKRGEAESEEAGSGEGHVVKSARTQ